MIKVPALSGISFNAVVVRSSCVEFISNEPIIYPILETVQHKKKLHNDCLPTLFTL